MAVSVSPGDAQVLQAGGQSRQRLYTWFSSGLLDTYMKFPVLFLLSTDLSKLCETWECLFSEVSLVAACWCCLSVAAHSLCSLQDFFGTVAVVVLCYPLGFKLVVLRHD